MLEPTGIQLFDGNAFAGSRRSVVTAPDSDVVGRTFVFVPADMGIWTEADTNPDADGHEIWTGSPRGAEGAVSSFSGDTQRGSCCPRLTLRRLRSRVDLEPAISSNRVIAVGGDVLFDPTTHGALLTSTNHWASYDTWDLWDGPRSDLSSSSRLNGHVLRTLGAQLDLGLPPVAPAVALVSSIGLDADRSLEMASVARSQGSEVRLAIVGSGAFWSQGRLLDDYVGQIAQLRPAGVFISVVRPDCAFR